MSYNILLFLLILDFLFIYCINYIYIFYYFYRIGLLFYSKIWFRIYVPLFNLALFIFS